MVGWLASGKCNAIVTIVVGSVGGAAEPIQLRLPPTESPPLPQPPPTPPPPHRWFWVNGVGWRWEFIWGMVRESL